MNVPDKAIEIKAAVTAVIAFLTALWGWLGWAVIVWLACVVLDYATGSWAARSNGEWSSAVARAGLWHKLGEIVAVLVAALCDIAISVIIGGSGLDLGIAVNTFVTPVVLLWYIITELGSITENADKLGAPVPQWLIKGLEQYKNKLDPEAKQEEKTKE
jgi:toxin secretion/phage lysis holin